jgi:hypothetical protein
MNITPTTTHKANSTGSKVIVYDVQQKKPVLLFKSIHLAVKYLFSPLLLKATDNRTYANLISKCMQQRKTEDKNIFALTLTYRWLLKANPLFDVLGDNDMVVMDEQFKSEAFEDKKFNSTRSDYDLENILQKGDFVEIKHGKLKGYITQVLEIKDKSERMTPGKKYYSLKINEQVLDFKANVLLLA